MKKFVLTAVLAFSVLPAAAQAFDGLLSNEDVVAAVILSPELSFEKQANAYLASMPLKSISIQGEKNKTVVFLSYSSGGAPCSVRAEVIAVRMSPENASEVHLKPVITSLDSACALN